MEAEKKAEEERIAAEKKAEEERIAAEAEAERLKQIAEDDVHNEAKEAAAKLKDEEEKEDAAGEPFIHARRGV